MDDAEERERRSGQGPPDMFANMRDTWEQPNDTGGVLMLFCIICCVAALYIGYAVWAIITIWDSKSVQESACGEIYDIWTYCALAIIAFLILCLQGLLGRISREMAAISGGCAAITLIVLAFWGFLMWFRMSDDCELYFSHSHYDLFLLFKINVVMLFISFCGSCCVLCMAIAVVAGAMGAGAAGGGGKNPFGGEDGGDALRQAAGEGNVAEVERLLAQSAENVNAPDSSGWTPLHHAANRGSAPVAELLIQKGANLDTENNQGQSPLNLAIGKGEVERVLRDAGARDLHERPFQAGAAATQEYV